MASSDKQSPDAQKASGEAVTWAQRITAVLSFYPGEGPMECLFKKPYPRFLMLERGLPRVVQYRNLMVDMKLGESEPAEKRDPTMGELHALVAELNAAFG